MYTVARKLRRAVLAAVLLALLCSVGKPVPAQAERLEATRIAELPADSTIAYICSQTTREFGNGDLILLKNLDENARAHYGLIDCGNRVLTNDGASSVARDYLRNHGVERLEWLVLTHHHGDHTGDAGAIISEFKPQTLYLKQFDHAWSPQGGSQAAYEGIVRKALSEGCRIVGVGQDSLNLSSPRLGLEAPSMSEKMYAWLAANQDKLAQVETFNEQNTSFSLGSAQLCLLNTEQWDETGAVWESGVSTTAHEVSAGENNNSLGVLLECAGTRSFWSGDINNLDASSATGIGDEDRLAPVIGDVDLLKLGHHGYAGSNTPAYLELLKPEYAVITNDRGRAEAATLDWLDSHKASYEWCTSDELGIFALFSQGQVRLGRESAGCMRKHDGSLSWASAERPFDSWPLELRGEKSFEVSTWEELKDLLDQQKSCLKVDELKHVAYLPKYVVRATAPLRANSELSLGSGQCVELVDMLIVRDAAYEGTLLHVAEGELEIKNSSIFGAHIQVPAPALYLEDASLWLHNSQLSGHHFERLATNGLGFSSTIAAFGSQLRISRSSLSDNVSRYAEFVQREAGVSNDVMTLYGAAIRASARSHVLAYNSSFSRNRLVSRTHCELTGTHVAASAASALYGAAIACVQSDLELHGCSVDNNSCSQDMRISVSQGAQLQNVGARGAQGTGIYVSKGNVQMTGCSVAHNWANMQLVIDNHGEETIYKPGEGSRGGGLCVVGATDAQKSTELTEVAFVGNSLEEGGAGTAGGAFVEGKLSMSACSFLDNQAGSAAALETLVAGNPVPSPVVVEMQRCIFSNNRTAFSSGGAWVSKSGSQVFDCEFINNQAETYGGAIMLAQTGQTLLQRCSFDGNRALTKHGGALRIDGVASLSDCVFSNNEAPAGAGGAISVRGASDSYAGGSYIDAGNNVFSANAASRHPDIAG